MCCTNKIVISAIHYGDQFNENRFVFVASICVNSITTVFFVETMEADGDDFSDISDKNDEGMYFCKILYSIDSTEISVLLDVFF